MRWAIKLFFKFIKGHMVIKHFYGNSYNAVKTQLFRSVITYCLLMIIKIENNFNCSLLEILRAVRNSPWGEFKKLLKLFSNKAVIHK
jgi:IS4 transposase